MAGREFENFTSWLSEKLQKLNSDVDLDVFVSYITGILETDTSSEDKQESLVGIIAEILPEDTVNEHCSSIIDKWDELNGEATLAASAAGDSQTFQTSRNIDKTIHSIIEQQTASAALSTDRTNVQSSANSFNKQAILAQYADVSDSDDDPLDVAAPDTSGSNKPAGCATPASGGDLLVKNMNSLMVKERERVERDRAKQESDAKRQKDKDDREKQKQKQQERKDAEKKRTQKGEKKR